MAVAMRERRRASRSGRPGGKSRRNTRRHTVEGFATCTCARCNADRIENETIFAIWQAAQKMA